MKTFLLTFSLVVIAYTSGLAQQLVKANEIIDRINKQQPVSYQNVTIIGDLDLTALANQKRIRNGNWGSTEQVLSVVEVPVTFTGCRFQGKLIAYRHLDTLGTNGTTFIADFMEPVRFEKCVFDEEVACKYSTFNQQAIFIQSRFGGLATFKYAKFRAKSDLSQNTFNAYTDFKYARFKEMSAFQGNAFNQYADFKYAQFDEGVTFQQAIFSNKADFKYTHFPTGSSFEQVQFKGSSDFKYATLGGESFSPR